ncbi:MAG: hypothetical protein WBK77_10860 [Alphaproteobacteria bacterium]
MTTPNTSLNNTSSPDIFIQQAAAALHEALSDSLKNIANPADIARDLQSPIAEEAILKSQARLLDTIFGRLLIKSIDEKMAGIHPACLEMALQVQKSCRRTIKNLKTLNE